MESLVEELTCPVCLDLYEQPVLLPCAHSLCKRCAGDICAEAVRKPPPQPAGTAVAPKQVQCPSCRHEFQLPEQGVDGLRRNTTLQNIVDRYREAKNNTAVPKAVPCEMCDEEPPADAVKTCLVCDTSYCEACLSKYHPMKAGLARHTLVEASAATPKVLMCTEHVQEKVNMYCETDECLVCSLCKLVGKHKDHEVAAVSDTFQQKKVSIGGCVAGLIQQNAEVECFVDKIQGTMTKAEQNCTDIQGRVEAFAQSLTTAIMKRKGLLQSKVAAEKDQKLKTLGKQLDQWADTGTGMTAAIAEAETLLNEEDPIAFLQASKAVEDRIAAFKFLEERKLNTTDQFIHNTLRVSDLEQRVSSLDFLQVPDAPRILTDKCTAGHDHITVCWAAGGNTPVDKYNVWYGKVNKESWQGSVSSTNTSIKLTALEGNTAYSAVVVAVNAAGQATSKPVNIKTKPDKFQRKVEMKTKEEKAGLLLKNVQWYYVDDNEEKQPYEPKVNYKIEEAYKARRAGVDFEVEGEVLHIDFRTMKETVVGNMAAGAADVIRHEPDEVMKIPETWTCMSDGGDEYKEVDLQPASREYKKVHDQFMKSMVTGSGGYQASTTARVIKIQRIQNASLWRQYLVRKKNMELDNVKSSQPVERILYHGTPHDPIPSINRTGFNRSYSGRNVGAACGNGAYFSVTASISAADNYARPDHNGYRYMYMARVLSGDMCKGQRNIIVPPAKDPSKPHITYDSVCDNPANPQVIVIFYDTQAYPGYLITFMK